MELNWIGLAAGLTNFVGVWAGHVSVRKIEREAVHLWMPALVGVFGASTCWGATELKEQAVREELGWYPYRVRKIEPLFADVIRKWRGPSL